jgi:hypothetical protein
MNFDELKAAWQAPLPHQGAHPLLSPSLGQVLIQQRSRGRLAELQRSLAWQGAVTIGSSPLLFWLVWWNPLGLTHWYSFVPPLGWASSFLLLGVLLLVERRRLRRRTQALPNLREALELALALQRQSLRGLGCHDWGPDGGTLGTDERVGSQSVLGYDGVLCRPDDLPLLYQARAPDRPGAAR